MLGNGCGFVHNGTILNKSVVLVGFMGVGKTTSGKLAANRMNQKFVDSDEEVEKKFGLTTTEIFQQFGENVFRKSEKEVIQTLLNGEVKVVSLGGGAFMDDDTRKLCLKDGIVVCLELSWKAWLQRMDQLLESRPMLKDRDIQEVKALFDERMKVYKKSHISLLIDDLTPDEAAAQIVESAYSFLKKE